ncbi:dynein heavy chain 1, axonemal [Drosophila guanche]|uniref:Blast:Dynein heavy chain 1, axonemal n=1 Tax=Drosophila guanche TaxID=7266 RepID=A0A3B0JVK0_DROGU|nr:dynein heavy chain 1, axonemal [Drosophila guanche]SPP86127.1 blast:Dynein heavy chain 1%2C axonemal [Drosophila guanche]
MDGSSEQGSPANTGGALSLQGFDNHREMTIGKPICIMPPRPGTAVMNYQELYIPRDQLTSVFYPIEEAQRWLTLVDKMGKSHRFPLPTILPKVIQTRYVPKRQLPKDVEVDRRRRQYQKINLTEELQRAGLTDEVLQPTEEQYNVMSEFAFPHKFPLSYFDDSNYDINSPAAWFALGVVGEAHYPLPAKAYLPFNRSLLRCQWVLASVTAYNEDTDLWKLISLEDGCTYEVPKLQFMFLAEDPHKYIGRLKAAIHERYKGEQLMLMELIVDCVLHEDIESTVFYSFKPIEAVLQAAKVSEQCKRRLRSEVNLVFERLMALYELEQFIIKMPKEFPQFRNIDLKEFLPRDFRNDISERERAAVQALGITMTSKRYDYLKASLFYCAGGIEAMAGVAIECQHIETMSIFVCNFSKPLALVDFLNSQEAHSDNVATYLKVNWPQQLTSVITLVLRALGKGYLDISLLDWTVYLMCKTSRFILQVKFRMQESMEVLLEKSLMNFSHFVCDPCLQFLKLRASYKWTSNYIDTEFPFHRPVFAMTLGINENRKVFYSTNPDEFQPALMDIYKRGLEKTSGVRMIDASLMTFLKFAPNMYILTVELIEDKFLVQNELMRQCYAKAVLPLKAYARMYEKFIDFYLLDINEYMVSYAAAKKPSSAVKRDILEHKRLKEELRVILPAFITIGPFYINVDTLKQFLIKKRIDIVRRIFEYYVDRMFETNELLLERCTEVYKSIAERPISIEHLYRIRDFAATVPDVVELLRADIQIMWLEYDLLDSFFYNLSDHQFAMKWNVYAWPHQILVRLSTLKEEQKIDIEEFLRQHASECQAFEERLESLNDEIQAYSLVFNPNRAQETSVDIKKTWTLIKELQKVSQMLQFRQTLFEQEPLSEEFLHSIIESFEPYKQLWYACSNFLKLEEATLGNPIIQVELEEVWNYLEELRSELQQSLVVFNEKPEIMEVAHVFMGKIDEFVPLYNSIRDLRNDNWMHVHWVELSQAVGVEIKYTVSMNYQYLIRKGILDFLQQVHDISVKANNEAESLRAALEEAERQRQAEEDAILLRKKLRKCRRDIL